VEIARAIYNKARASDGQIESRGIPAGRRM
jgi:hypothetical protein